MGGFSNTGNTDPQQQFNQYSNVLFGTPSAGFTPNFCGTQAQQAPGAGDDVGNTISPQQQYNMYSNVLFGTPPSGYTPNFGAPTQRPIGIGMPVERPGQPGFGPAPIDGQNPIYSEPSPFQPPAPMPNPTPSFQTTYQQMGYNSLEAMKDATDPNWRNSPAQPGFGPAPISGGGGKSMGGRPGPFINKPGYVSGTEQPLQGTPMQAPSSVFQGGLRPAPRNFRPPARRGNLRSFFRR
jgi:hypothetical protein